MVGLFYSRRETMQRIISTLVLAFLLAACAAPQITSQPPASSATDPTATQPQALPAETETPLPESAATASAPLAVPTSRGNALVASDPSQLNLASGSPVLVEFFRFT